MSDPLVADAVLAIRDMGDKLRWLETYARHGPVSIERTWNSKEELFRMLGKLCCVLDELTASKIAKEMA